MVIESMRLTDGLLLTVLNTVVCLVLPRIVSIVFSPQFKKEKLRFTPINQNSSAPEIVTEVVSEVGSY